MIFQQPTAVESSSSRPEPPRPSLTLRLLGLIFPLLVVLAVGGFFYARHYVRTALQTALPQIDGTLTVPGLSAPVTVERDAHGVPHIRAASLDDLLFAQGYVTAQDRLWQMDTLRRHAAGELAEILGPSMLAHDRLQRTLGLRDTADRAIALLDPAQLHQLDQYARGVNALIRDQVEAQRTHLPLEFLVLRYQPAPWTPRDSLLVNLAMFQDMTTTFPVKLAREAITARLAPELVADLYPTSTWRDHPPAQPLADLTLPQTEDQAEGTPLDESQMAATEPKKPGGPSFPVLSERVGYRAKLDRLPSPADLLSLNRSLHPLTELGAPGLASQTWVRAGSNAWAVSGAHTASGQPLLSNDMHLNLSLPGTWYEANLEVVPADPATKAFHAAGVTLPGVPFICVGQNDHVAWGFTNLGADVQDIYIEHTRGSGATAEYQLPPAQTADPDDPAQPEGVWRPILHRTEIIHVKDAADVTLDVALTRHGDTATPIISALFRAPGAPPETRTLALRWTALDPANLAFPDLAVNSATDSASLVAAFATLGGPTLNLIYAEAGTAAAPHGHIGFHVVGRIPIRGNSAAPTPLTAVPTDAAAVDAATHEWSGNIPYDKLPQALDPPDGVLATANSRVTPPDYPYPITLDWAAPYRAERLYRRLEGGNGAAATPRTGLTPADMLALDNDVYSELDYVLARHFAYAIDHASGPLKDNERLHVAADLLRRWNGNVDADSSAAAIVIAARAVFWPMLLIPKLGKTAPAATPAKPNSANDAPAWTLYTWGDRAFVEEQLVMHTPARWLPPAYATWDDFLAAVVDTGLRDAHAPIGAARLPAWTRGEQFPIDLEHPIYSRYSFLPAFIGFPTGTGRQALAGDSETIKQTHPGRAPFGPSERFTADLADPDNSTINLPLGQSGSPASPWFLDQFKAWLAGSTYLFPLNRTAPTHTLTLVPR